MNVFVANSPRRELLHTEVLQHLTLHLVQLRTAEDQAVQRRAEVHFAEFFERAEADKLVFLPHASQSDRQRVRTTHYPSRTRSSVPPLPCFSSTSNSSSIAWLQVMKRGGRYTVRPFISSLKSGSFTLMSGWELGSIATKQTQSMQTDGVVLDDALVEAVRSPGFGEEADRDRLAEAVELQTAASTSIHNGGIVNHLNWDVLLLRTNPEVRVRRGTEIVKTEETPTQIHHRRRETPRSMYRRLSKSFHHSTQRDHDQQRLFHVQTALPMDYPTDSVITNFSFPTQSTEV